MKHQSTIVMIAVLLFAASVIITQTSQGNDAAVASSDPAIVDKLQTIVTLRERLAKSNELAIHNGKGETDGRYELALAKARLRLSQELGQRTEQIAALKEILKVHQRRLEDAKKQSEVGAVSPDDVDMLRVEVLEAEVRLLRAQNSSKKP